MFLCANYTRVELLKNRRHDSASPGLQKQPNHDYLHLVIAVGVSRPPRFGMSAVVLTVRSPRRLVLPGRSRGVSSGPARQHNLPLPRGQQHIEHQRPRHELPPRGWLL